MDLTVEQAAGWFRDTPVEELLRPLLRVGLSYLHLNQSLSTLSGGELQRLKLASYLGQKGQVFILDEPTDGLHLSDIQNSIRLFQDMVEAGNSVFLVEHNLEVLKAADYVVELGPGGGSEGGRLLFAGTPAQLLECPQSVTASIPSKRSESRTGIFLTR